MKYKKKFNKNKTKVTITATGNGRSFWDWKETAKGQEKIFEVVKKEEIYKKIKNGELIDLEDKMELKLFLTIYCRRDCEAAILSR